jgi:hypothetical protein
MTPDQRIAILTKISNKKSELRTLNNIHSSTKIAFATCKDRERAKELNNELSDLASEISSLESEIASLERGL